MSENAIKATSKILEFDSTGGTLAITTPQHSKMFRLKRK